MAGSSVVNLLDLRDEEENRGAATGGRWARRNPKGSAKAPTRNRRQRHRDDAGGGGDGRRSGFGRKQSNASEMSVSDVDEEEGQEESPEQHRRVQADESHREAPPPRAPPTEVHGQATEPVQTAPSHPAGKDPLFTKLSSNVAKDDAGRSEPLNASASDAAANAAEYAALANMTAQGSEENVFEEARKVALQREGLKDWDAGLQGKDFKRKYWEYYMVKATWSDGLFVAFNHPKMFPSCFFPCLWPVRLFLTIQRAAPVKIKFCIGSCPIGSCCGCFLVFWIFALPVLAMLTFVPQLSQIMQDNFDSIPVLKDRDDKQAAATEVSLALTAISLFLMVFWWARMLLGIGTKYQIKQAMNKPGNFVCQAMICICAMNSRAAVHVDRAQGFMAPLKGDKTAVELSDQIRLVNPQQNVMV